MSEQNKDAELLPCPFCGSTDLEVHGKPGILNAHDDVGCNGCNAFTPAPTWNRRSLPAGVPDGYMPIPTAEHLAEALANVRCFHDMSAELIAPELLANLLGAPTVKAEQADEAKRIDKQCRDDVAAALGFVSGGNFAWSYLLTQIKECVRVAEAPSLPAAGLTDLTAVRCQCCATEYPHDSYDAGFIAGSGMCQVCDAAIPAKDLPAAGSAVEEVEVVAYQSIDATRGGGYMAHKHQLPQSHIDDGALQEPLMTVAQHNRIVAALSAQKSAHVSVPRELLGRAMYAKDGRELIEANRELRALLNGGEA